MRTISRGCKSTKRISSIQPTAEEAVVATQGADNEGMKGQAARPGRWRKGSVGRAGKMRADAVGSSSGVTGAEGSAASIMEEGVSLTVLATENDGSKKDNKTTKGPRRKEKQVCAGEENLATCHSERIWLTRARACLCTCMRGG